MKSKIMFCLMALFMMVSMTSCYERVDAGHEGIKVNLYGSEKGVDDISLVTGIVWYNPWTTTIYEYPTYVQTVDFEPFSVNAQEGPEFTIDPTISIRVMDGKSPIIFKKYRKELPEVIKSTIYNYVKDAYRTQLNSFTTDYIISHRDSIERAAENYLAKALYKEGFELGPVTSGLKYPQSIVDAVTAKSKAIQEAQKVQNELAVVKAEAEKVVVKAKAEAEANKLREQALTPAILQKMWIEKWDGTLPTVTSGNNMMLNLKDLK